MVSFRVSIIDIERIIAKGWTIGKFGTEAFTEKLERETTNFQGSKWEKLPKIEKIIVLNKEMSSLEHQIHQIKKDPEYLKTIRFTKKLREFRHIALRELRGTIFHHNLTDYNTIRKKIEENKEQIPRYFMNRIFQLDKFEEEEKISSKVKQAYKEKISKKEEQIASLKKIIRDISFQNGEGKE